MSQDFESLAISAQETVNQLQKKNEELVANHSKLLENVSNLKTQLHEESTQKKCFEATVSDFNEEICSIKKISAEQEIGINSFKEALANVNLEKEALVATLEGVRKENEELKISNDQIKKAINDVRDENVKLLSSMNEMKIATESINFDFEQKETMWREQIEKLVKEKTAFEEEISSLKENNKENLLEDKVEKLSQEKASYEEEITKLKKIIRESNEEPTKNEEIDVHVELHQEIERLKSELIFVNEEKRKLEETYQTEDKKSMLEKLSATLSCIEESFVVPPDAETSLVEESSANLTISGTGITIETVLDIKNQLLALQNEIGLYDPEELRMKDEKIQDLIKVNEDLVKAESKLSSESSKLHEEYEDKMEAMRKQHQGEMAIITQKMKDDMKNNLAALEDKLRDEYENKEMAIITQKMKDDMKNNLA